MVEYYLKFNKWQVCLSQFTISPGFADFQMLNNTSDIGVLEVLRAIFWLALESEKEQKPDSFKGIKERHLRH